MSKYKITFTEKENCKFNLIENESIRKSCMSIYMYMLKLININKENFLKADLNAPGENVLKISYREFLKKYTRNHTSISLPTLKSRLELLLKLKLIAVEKYKNSFIYSFVRFCSNEKPNKKPNDLEQPKTVVMPKLVKSNKKHKYLNIKSYIDLDSNSTISTSKKNNFNFKNKEKVTSWDYIDILLKKAFKALKVRSSYIKSVVVSKLFKYYTSITKEYAMSYICKTIESARKQHFENYNKYVVNNKTGNYNNYSQRQYSKEQLDIIEKKLLGLV